MHTTHTIRLRSSVALILALAVSAVSAAGIGGQGGAVYRAPAGAAAFALGGAQTADPAALRLWWNPASLAGLKSRSLSLGGGLRSFGRTEATAGFEFPLPPRLGAGISFVYRGDAKIDNLHDAEDRLLPAARYAAYAVHAGASYQITRRIAAGAAVEYLYEQMPIGGSAEEGIVYASARPALGLDLGMVANLSERWRLGLSIRHLMARVEMSPEADAAVMAQSLEDTLLMPITLGQRLRFTCLERPLTWHTDLGVSVLKSDFSRAARADAVVNNGVEWQLFEKLSLRMGLREIHVNRDLFRDSESYGASFHPVVSGGFGLVPVNVKVGKASRILTVNYGISNDRIRRGVDQQLDMQLVF